MFFGYTYYYIKRSFKNTYTIIIHLLYLPKYLLYSVSYNTLFYNLITLLTECTGRNKQQ